jgi:hypothetical protein
MRLLIMRNLIMRRQTRYTSPFLGEVDRRGSAASGDRVGAPFDTRDRCG